MNNVACLFIRCRYLEGKPTVYKLAVECLYIITFGLFSARCTIYIMQHIHDIYMQTPHNANATTYTDIYIQIPHANLT